MHAKPHTKRAILKLRIKATLDFGLFSARPPLLSLRASAEHRARQRAEESRVRAAGTAGAEQAAGHEAGTATEAAK